MATIKSYTDISQSKKLAEILPIESADCFWDYDDLQKYHRINWFEDCYNKYSQLRLNKNNVCAWSLTALLSVLPRPSLHQTKDKRWYCNAEPNRLYFSEHHNNPVDACYEMILKLNELKMLLL